MKEFYKNIRQKRIELNMTQTELANKVGYSDKSMIARIERGDIDLPQSKIVLFADALDMTPCSLILYISVPGAFVLSKGTLRVPQGC